MIKCQDPKVKHQHKDLIHVEYQRSSTNYSNVINKVIPSFRLCKVFKK